MNQPNPKIDAFLKRAQTWQPEMLALRQIALQSPLTEQMKWGQPCYTLDHSNIVLIHAFKDYCALLFIKGALLKDPQHLLIQQTKNVQAARQLRFISLPEILKLKPVIKAYINEAIAIEKAGLKVPHKKTADFPIPEELQTKFTQLPNLKAAFNSLTPGRQRGYLLFISSAKQSQTRLARIEKVTPKILNGKGLND